MSQEHERPYGEVLDEMDHERKYQSTLNELTTQRALLRDALVTLNHARVFISTREKMHPVGIGLYDDLVRQIEDAVGPTSSLLSAAYHEDHHD